MDFKGLISLIDNVQNTTKPTVVTESKNTLSQYMDIIAEEHSMDEKVSFHHTGNKSAFKRHIKNSHGISGSVYSSARKGAKHILKNSDNPADTVTVDIPLLIRLLEYAKEDAQTDMDLHNVAEKMIEFGKDGEVLTMDNYDAIVGEQEQLPPPSEGMN